MKMYQDEFIGKTGVDARGVKWRIEEYDPETLCNPLHKRRYIIIFNNRTKASYTREQLQKCKRGQYATWETGILSRESAYEWIGRKLTDSTGHSYTITRVTKYRTKCLLSYVEVEWDTGEKCEVMINSIVKRDYKYNKKYFEKDEPLQPEIIKNFGLNSLGGYCYLPEGMNEMTVLPKTTAKWTSMLNRVKESCDTRARSYENVTICDEWKNLYNFAIWLQANYIDGYELDKDLLYPGNTEYTPDKCTYIHKSLNLALTYKPKTFDLPTGVSRQNKPGDRSPYMSNFSILGKDFTSVAQSILEAFVMYKVIKEYYIAQLGKYIYKGDTPRDIKHREACENYVVYDVRYNSDNLITEDMVKGYMIDRMNHLRLDPSIKDRNYIYIKNMFIRAYNGVFYPKFKVVDQLVEDEFTDVKTDDYDYDF